MNRLSERAIEIVNDLHTERLDYNSEYVPLIDALNRLAAYEDMGLEPEAISETIQYFNGWVEADNEGRLIVLPCKVGDTVWAIRHNPWTGAFVRDFTVSVVGAAIRADKTTEIIVSTTKDDVWGKTVFSTREEAEASLKEET